MSWSRNSGGFETERLYGKVETEEGEQGILVRSGSGRFGDDLRSHRPLGWGDKDYCAANDVGFRFSVFGLNKFNQQGGRVGAGGVDRTQEGEGESQREHNRKWSGPTASRREGMNCLRTRSKLTRKEARMMGYYFGTHGRDMRRDSCTSAVSTGV